MANNKDYNFQYTPLTGSLPGKSFVKQTEQAINELAGLVNEGAAQVEVITNLANQANDNSEEALEKANEALETAGRVYITLPNLDDADDYFDSQLYYFANSYSANLPVQDTGFLEVKTNDTKTAAEQVFIADTTGLMYMRHGVITSSEVGEETVYSVTWETWSSALASESYVQEELLNYLPLSGGTMTGEIERSGYFIKNINDTSAIVLRGGSDSTSALISLYGKSHSSTPGRFELKASDGENNEYLVGNPDGTLTWGGVDLLPIGVVQAFAGSTTPNGWLLCDGTAVSRTTYAKLFAVIGTTYGSGDGTSTFNLPNLIDKFVQGNATSGTVKTAGLPNIEGTLRIAPDGSNVSAVSEATGAFVASGGANIYQYSRTSTTMPGKDYAISLSATLSSAIYGKSTTVQPPAVTMRYIIKY